MTIVLYFPMDRVSYFREIHSRCRLIRESEGLPCGLIRDMRLRPLTDGRGRTPKSCMLAIFQSLYFMDAP